MTTEQAPEPQADPTNPSDMLSTATTAIPKEREFVIKRPGNINIAGERGNYPGCRVIGFGPSATEGLEEADAKAFEEQLREFYKASARPITAPDAANLYFKHRANMLVVNQSVDVNGTIWCWVTNQLEDEALEDFLEFSKDWEDYSSKRRTEREEARKEANKAKEEAAKEEKALAALGRKARDHNLLGKLEELTAQLEETRKELNKLKKAKK